jgi:hypothetical protein
VTIHISRTPLTADRWYQARAASIRADAHRDLADGYAKYFYDEIGFAVIAERAARAEIVDPPDRMLPCGICFGKVRCDIDFHRRLA